MKRLAVGKPFLRFVIPFSESICLLAWPECSCRSGEHGPRNVRLYLGSDDANVLQAGDAATTLSVCVVVVFLQALNKTAGRQSLKPRDGVGGKGCLV